jgi:glyoxylate reductase
VRQPKVYVTRIIPDAGLNRLREKCDVDIWPDNGPIDKHVLLKKSAGVDGLVTLLSDPIDREVMDAAGGQVKVISNYAVGYDNIDLLTATERGILVCNTPDILTETTADLAFTLLMAAARRLQEGIQYVCDGNWITWGPKLLLGQDIYGSTLGIVGMGRIGKAVARRGIGFDMRVVYYDDNVDPSDTDIPDPERANTLDDLLSVSDYVSLHTPLTPDTHEMMDSAAFSKMKSNAIIVNTARGKIIDSDALYDALKSGQIAGAALDVTDPEPLPPDHKLLQLPSCIVVPHIGSATVATRDAMAVMCAENLLAGLDGNRPKHLVNPDAFEHKRWKS